MDDKATWKISLPDFFSPIWLLILVLLTLGCGSDESASARVAVVNGEIITDEDLGAELARLPKALQQRYASTDKRRALLDQLIDRRLLLQAARERGLDRDPDLRAKLEDLEQRLLLEALKQNIAAEAISEQAVRAYYEEHLDEYVDEQVRVRQILVRDGALADSLVEKLDAGADFAALAREYSVDPSARRGGDLGYLSRGRMDPSFERAAFSLRDPGERTRVDTRFGHHVIELVERPAQRNRSFDQVRLSIEQKLSRDAVDAFLEQQRASARIEVELADDAARSPAPPATPDSSG